MINHDLFTIQLYWKSLVSISFICWLRSRAPPTIDGKGPRSRQQALKSQILTFIWYLRTCFQTWNNLYVVNNAKSDGSFPLIFLTKMFVDYALTPSLTSGADPWKQFRESNARSIFSEWNRMQSIPDLHLLCICLMAIVETGNRKDNNRELITGNNKEF